MPGRQAHGRPLLPGPANVANGKKPGKSHARTFKKSRAKATAKALDAFAIAAEEVPESTRGVRTRGLEDRPAKRPRRGDDGEEEDFNGFDDEDDAPRKKARRGDDDGFSDGAGGEDGESDSEEWHVGVNAEDEDSEIDSDEAFGESDEERFDGYAFSGSSSKNNKKKKKPQKRRGDEEVDDDDDEGEEEEDDEDDLESLGSDAIDLATALDQYEEDEDEEEEEGSGSEEDQESADSDDESEDDEVDPSKLGELESMIAGFAGDEDKEEEAEPAQTGKTKLSLKDLGLTGIKDEHIKKSLRLMSKEEKAVKPGSSKKLEVPLAKRQQDKLMRSAAYEKTTETLDRWIETVKHNRRADHLVFPLAQNAHDRGLSTGELMPITQKTSGTELEQTILAIMEESGLGPSATSQQKNDGEAAPQLTQAEIQEIARQRRRERELHSREMARAKRIKKIKSKTYRRIHRKEMKRLEEAELEAKLEAGELDSEEEREALDRRRALERVGTRLRESKWAKLGKKAGRAVWDENFRASLSEAARRQEDLRRRIEGRANGSDNDDDDDDDDSASDASGDGDVRRRLRAELEKAAAYEEDDEPKSKLMQMKFMQRGEEQRRKENEEAIAELRRQLDSDGEGLSEDDEKEIGRRQYGMGNSTATATTPAQASKLKAAESRPSVGSTAAAAGPEPARSQSNAQANGPSGGGAWTSTEAEPSAPGAAGVWSQVETSGKKSKKASKVRGAEIDISSATIVAAQPSQAKPQAQAAKGGEAQDGGQDSDEEFVSHLPMAIRDQKLIERAFAGEDVHGQFEEEKAEVEREDDEKEIDNTLPGWGSWVGEGVSKREQRRHQGRFVTKVEGVKKTDRKDYKLKGVIISEKRVKKNDKYLASQLPHPFESQHQYERSLRLPMGPEWSTKETFQDATKPRVILKQGIIAPMSKPMY
ncbi:hypothetical protein VTJ83DRAFT_7283 [Remersonia thermophila]|uniref:Uncharacterized protein n=1 Tax=Remersonia thermophila TaxID=72144 RepID=A0ABR4D319_9PEZI